MRQLNIMITRAVETEVIKQIEDIGPWVKVTCAGDLMEAENKGDISATAKLDKMLKDTEVIYGFWAPKNVLNRAPNLKWMHTMLAGVENLLTPEIVKSGIIITNGRGVHDIPCAETAVTMMMMFVKRMPEYFIQKQEKVWDRLPPRVALKKTVGIIGLGSIGAQTARMSKAFGMRVIGVRRSATKVTKSRYADAVYPPDQLHEVLAQSDFVIMALPYTPETDKLMGAKEFKAMKKTGYVINIGRGTTMDEAALVDALEKNVIAGAGLDAFAVEPLPKNSKLWGMPNVIYSPHVSGGGEDIWLIATDQFCENVRRYAEGKKLINLVDKKRGY